MAEALKDVDEVKKKRLVSPPLVATATNVPLSRSRVVTVWVVLSVLKLPLLGAEPSNHCPLYLMIRRYTWTGLKVGREDREGGEKIKR